MAGRSASSPKFAAGSRATARSGHIMSPRAPNQQQSSKQPTVTINILLGEWPRVESLGSGRRRRITTMQPQKIRPRMCRARSRTPVPTPAAALSDIIYPPIYYCNNNNSWKSGRVSVACVCERRDGFATMPASPADGFRTPSNIPVFYLPRKSVRSHRHDSANRHLRMLEN